MSAHSITHCLKEDRPMSKKSHYEPGRRLFAKQVLSAASLAYLAPRALAKAVHRSSGNSSPPNILMIFPDQWRYSALGFWNQPPFKGVLGTVADPVITPNLDALARESVVVTHAVSTMPVCSPYRAMMMSGRYVAKTGIDYGNCEKDNDNGMYHSLPCITDLLYEAGYDTGYVGKTHWEKNEPLFNKKHVYVGQVTPPGGYHIYSNDTYIPPGRGRHSCRYWFQSIRDVHKNPLCYSSIPRLVNGRSDGEPYQFRKFSPVVEADVVIDFLKNQHNDRNPKQPFCMIWAPNPPHPPYYAPKDCDETVLQRYYATRDPAQLLVRKNWHKPTKPHHRSALDAVQYYFANITAVDREIGRVLKALDEAGLKENTIVIFTSDHGEMMGSHGALGKMRIYDEAFRIPLLIRYPARLKPRVEKMFFTPVDMMPTLLGLAGLSEFLPPGADGFDYSKRLMGDADPKECPKAALFYTKSRKGLRTFRYTFEINQSGKTLLFDNLEDPYQLKNIDPKSVPTNKLTYIRKTLGNLLRKANDPWYQSKTRSDFIIYPS